MNILYIGPYRDNTSEGLQSLNYLLHINDEYKNLIARPILSRNANHINNNDINNKLNTLEKKTINNIDICIQNLEISSISYTSKIKKHIFIPIQNEIFPTTYNIDKYKLLNNFGSFVSFSNKSSFVFQQINIKNFQTINNSIHNSLIINNNQKFNLGLYNIYNKYYTITNNISEHKIYHLILNFIRLINDEKSCLIIFMTNSDQNIINKYNTYVKNTYQALKINYSINKVIIAPVNTSAAILSDINNTGNIYIDLDDNIYKDFALAYDKSCVINKSNLELVWDHNNLEKNGLINNKQPINLDLCSTITDTDLLETYLKQQTKSLEAKGYIKDIINDTINS